MERLLDCTSAGAPFQKDYPLLTNNEYQTPEYASAYLARAAGIPHRGEGEAVLLSFVPRTCKHILDLGTGGGRLLALLRDHCPEAELVGLDFSSTMIATASARFADDPRVSIREHDLANPLPADLPFDAIVTGFAIHHCSDERKRTLYAEIYDRLAPGGIFCNLEHVSSPTSSLHQRFLDGIGSSTDDEDPSNVLLDVATQLGWLRNIGFQDVDCHWKWLELALIGGVRR